MDAYLKQAALDYAHAKMIAPYSNDKLVGELTRGVLDSGCKMLQIHRLAPTEEEHAAKLLEMFNLPLNARVLDAGCGVGAVSEEMHKLRPDLHFVLQNISAEQLMLCPDFEQIHGDFHGIPVPDDSFDAAMFNYSIGHAELDRVLKEMRRILKKDGVLFIYDLCGDAPQSVAELGYKIHQYDRLVESALGFRLTKIWAPQKTYVDHFGLLHQQEFQRIFAHTHPVAYRFLRN